MKEHFLKPEHPVEISVIKFELSEDDVYRMNMLELEEGSVEQIKRNLTGLMRIRVPQGYNPHFKFSVIMQDGISVLRIAGNLFNFIDFVKAHKNILPEALIVTIEGDKTAAAIVTNSKSYRAPRNVEFERVLPDAVSDADVVKGLITELTNTLSVLPSEERKEALEELKRQLPVVNATATGPQKGFWSKRSK